MRFTEKWDLSSRAKTTLLLFIRLSLMLSFVASLLSQNWVGAFVSVVTFGATYLPKLIERQLEIDIPFGFEIAIILFVYSSIFLGEVHDFYERFWWWDILLHGVASALIGIAGFLTLYVLYKGGKVKTRPSLIMVFAFSFAMAIGASWEIFEFGMDTFFGLNMQKSGLVDTMTDLIIDGVGAFIVSLSGYFYLKNGKSTIIGKTMEWFRSSNPDVFDD